MNTLKRKRKTFTPFEDMMLMKAVQTYGIYQWENVALMVPCRNARQCRDRWCNFLDPSLNHNSWTEEEDTKLWQLFLKFGNKWVRIAKQFPNRTDGMIKNRWKVLNRQIKKGKTIEQSISYDISDFDDSFYFSVDDNIDSSLLRLLNGPDLEEAI